VPNKHLSLNLFGLKLDHIFTYLFNTIFMKEILQAYNFKFNFVNLATIKY